MTPKGFLSADLELRTARRFTWHNFHVSPCRGKRHEHSSIMVPVHAGLIRLTQVCAWHVVSSGRGVLQFTCQTLAAVLADRKEGRPSWTEHPQRWVNCLPKLLRDSNQHHPV